MLPQDLQPGSPLYAAWLNALKNAVVDEIIGDGQVCVTRVGGKITIGLGVKIPGIPDLPFEGMFTSSTLISPNRWSYSFVEVIYKKLGEYEVLAGGRSGVAYNRIETNNTSSGVQGNGVNVSTLPAGKEIVPLGVGAVTKIDTKVNCDTGEVEYEFGETNAVGEECEA